MVRRALLSVSDKSGIVELAMELTAMGAEILSTGGTAKVLRNEGITVKDVSEHTGFPEMMDGRLKTLHPRIHGGLLFRRNNARDVQEAEAHGIAPIDVVVVNLYPFEKTVANPGVSFDEAIENIDIGGPAMIRAASKNFEDVVVVVDPADYGPVLEELKSSAGALTRATRLRLAHKVFEHTSRYDGMIAAYLAKHLAG